VLLLNVLLTKRDKISVFWVELPTVKFPVKLPTVKFPVKLPTVKFPVKFPEVLLPKVLLLFVISFELAAVIFVIFSDVLVTTTLGS